MVRWYVLPIETIDNYRGPKYLAWRWNSLGLAVPWGMMDYGLMPVAIAWVDAEQADHDFLAAQSDVAQVPADLDSAVGAAANAIGTRMETDYLIPADWLKASDTWRQTLRTVAGIFQFAQRIHGITGGALLGAGVTNNTQWRNLTDQQQAAWAEAMQSFGLDTAWIRSNTQVRAISKFAADYWADKPFYMGQVTL